MIAVILAIVLAAVAVGLLIVRQRSLVKELNELNERLGERPSSRPADAVALLERSVDRVMRHDDDDWCGLACRNVALRQRAPR